MDLLILMFTIAKALKTTSTPLPPAAPVTIHTNYFSVFR